MTRVFSKLVGGWSGSRVAGKAASRRLPPLLAAVSPLSIFMKATTRGFDFFFLLFDFFFLLPPPVPTGSGGYTRGRERGEMEVSVTSPLCSLTTWGWRKSVLLASSR